MYGGFGGILLSALETGTLTDIVVRVPTSCAAAAAATAARSLDDDNDGNDEETKNEKKVIDGPFKHYKLHAIVLYSASATIRTCLSHPCIENDQKIIWLNAAHESKGLPSPDWPLIWRFLYNPQQITIPSGDIMETMSFFAALHYLQVDDKAIPWYAFAEVYIERFWKAVLAPFKAILPLETRICYPSPVYHPNVTLRNDQDEAETKEQKDSDEAAKDKAESEAMNWEEVMSVHQDVLQQVLVLIKGNYTWLEDVHQFRSYSPLPQLLIALMGAPFNRKGFDDGYTIYQLYTYKPDPGCEPPIGGFPKPELYLHVPEWHLPAVKQHFGDAWPPQRFCRECRRACKNQQVMSSSPLASDVKLPLPLTMPNEVEVYSAKEKAALLKPILVLEAIKESRWDGLDVHNLMSNLHRLPKYLAETYRNGLMKRMADSNGTILMARMSADLDLRLRLFSCNLSQPDYDYEYSPDVHTAQVLDLVLLRLCLRLHTEAVY